MNHRFQNTLCNLLLATAMAFGWMAPGTQAAGPAPESVNRAPTIDPDYTGLVIPPNIAPLNFVLKELGGAAVARASGPQGEAIEVPTRQGQVRWPLAAWHALLKANQGGEIHFEIRQQDTHGVWRQYQAITNQVADEAIDSHMVTRQLNWQLSMYNTGTMGIYQRDLTSFKETELVHIKQRGSHGASCVNCHTFANNQPDAMALHFRLEEKDRKPMLIYKNGIVTTLERPGQLLSWHPSGEVITFSANKFAMIYHTTNRINDVYDDAGDLAHYDLTTMTMLKPPGTSRAEVWESWPTWSPDGKFLYFCSTPKSSMEYFMNIRYDLKRIPFDLKTRTWGEVETVLPARVTGLSAAEPRISPDGQFIMLSMIPYGSFPGTQPGSDLYVMNLQSRELRKMSEVNSPYSDTWHCWSSNSRWFVFSSKRRDGLLTRPHLSYFDTTGRARKPFIVPMEDPTAYDCYPKLYNLPELITGPVKVTKRKLFEAVYEPKHRVTPKGESTMSPVPATPAKKDYQLFPQ